MTKFPHTKLTKIDKIKCIVLAAELNDSQVVALKSLYSEVDKKQLIEESVVDEVASHLIDKLRKYKLEYPDGWNVYYEEVDKRIGNLMNELESVASHLKAKNIQIVGLKNAGIAKGIYKNNACSPMGDIDLLVRSTDFYKAHEIIINSLGYTFKFRSELEKEDLEEAFRGGGTEYYKDVNGYKVWLELQWRPVAGRWIQPHNEPNGDELMSRSIPVLGSDVRMLCPEDNLLQVCLHTAKHSYCRAPGFRLHSDVDRIVRFQQINWDKFIDLVKSMKLKVAVYHSLMIASELLKTPVPTDILRSIKPGGLRKKIIESQLIRAGLTNQNKSKFSKRGYILFNLALYDNIKEMSTAIIPSKITMKKRYNFENILLLPYYHTKRIISLLLKRAKL